MSIKDHTFLRRKQQGKLKGNGRSNYPRVMVREDSRYFRVSPDVITAMGVALEEAMNPAKMPGPVRTLSDMTPAEIENLERRYGCPVKRTDGDH